MYDPGKHKRKSMKIRLVLPLILPVKATDLTLPQAVCRVDLFWYVLDESEFEGRVQAYKIEYYNHDL